MFIFGNGGSCVVKIVLLVAFFVAIFFVLYHQGYMIVKSTSAVSFIGSARGNAARFTSCNGYIKRIVRFKDNGTYNFLLDLELSKGDLSVELLDSANDRIMQLDSANRRGSITIKKGQKYYMVIHFKSATGRYALVRE